MKLLIIVATLGLATFVVLRRRNPELTERVGDAVEVAAGHVTDEAPGRRRRVRVRDKAESLVDWSSQPRSTECRARMFTGIPSRAAAGGNRRADLRPLLSAPRWHCEFALKTRTQYEENRP